MNKILLLFFLSAFIACGQPKKDNLKNKANQKPNVLFICVDDLRPELGCYGKEYIHTPNIDHLAQSGTIFTHHYVQVPTSGASRYSMLTGMLPATRGHLSNNAFESFISEEPESEKPETFIHHLRRNGYYTVGVGKISHSADGFLYAYTDSVSTKYELPYSWDEMLFDHGKWGTGWNAFFGYGDGENRQSMKNQVKPYEMGDVDDLGYPDGLTAQLAIKKIEELADKDEPFFLSVGFFKPHLPFNSPKKYWDMYDEDSLPLSPNPFIPENVNKASLQESGEFNSYQLGDEAASLEGPISDAYARKLRHAYFACVSYTDALIGKVLDELDKQGLRDNTIVVLWGDHGWHLGDQLVWGKHTIFERAVNSPLIISAPNKLETANKTIQNIVSSVDIYPTLMEMCAVEMPHPTDGKSLVPLLKDDKNDLEEAAYSYFRNGITMRTNRYRLTKYFRNQQPVIELYDHETDPNETKNIARENQDIIDKLMPLWEKGNTGIY